MTLLLILTLAIAVLLALIVLLLIVMAVRSIQISRMPGSDAVIAAGLFIPWPGKMPKKRGLVVGPPYPYKDGRSEDPDWFDPSAENVAF